LLRPQWKQFGSSGIFSFSLGLLALIIAKKNRTQGMDAVLYG
jgi:hypothetical protein